MKRRDLLRMIRNFGCVLVREGAEHSIWENPNTGRRASIPRHREINDYTARRIVEQLGGAAGAADLP